MTLKEAYSEKRMKLLIRTDDRINSINLWLTIYPFRNNVKMTTHDKEITLKCDLEQGEGLYVLSKVSQLCEENQAGLYIEMSHYFKERRV